METGILIIIGVFTGVFTSVIIWLANRVFYQVILPWYQSKVYKGVLLEGRWNGRMQINNITWSLTLVVKQSGNILNGNFTAISNDTNAKKKETYMRFDGTIINGYVILTCTSSDPREISFGAMILRIRNKCLKGKQIFRDLSESKVDVFESKVEFTHESF
jgi:hypothetical protein